ncbi:MAG: hypothetical protein ABH803_04585 [Candidatus Micrarchaeota archaeon]
MKKGRIIVLDGLSASGKATQAKLLADYLVKQGVNARLMAFPTYDQTEAGTMVGKYLRGDFGLKEKIPEFASLLYSADRYQYRKMIQEELENGVWFVFDRYISSNLGFQAAFFEGEEKKAFIDWLKRIDSRMPPADAVVFLDVPRSFSEKLIQTREQKNVLTERDIHEIDAVYEGKVRETFLSEAKESGWIVVDCVIGNELKSKLEIHASVVSALKNKGVLS